MIASIVPPPAASPDAAMWSPRRTAMRRASGSDIAPAAASAESSPSECPATATGSTWSRRRDQPASDAQRIAGWAKRVDSSTRGNGSSPTSSSAASRRSGRTSATRSRMSGVWLPCPGNRTAGSVKSSITPGLPSAREPKSDPARYPPSRGGRTGYAPGLASLIAPPRALTRAAARSRPGPSRARRARGARAPPHRRALETDSARLHDTRELQLVEQRAPPPRAGAHRVGIGIEVHVVERQSESRNGGRIVTRPVSGARPAAIAAAPVTVVVATEPRLPISHAPVRRCSCEALISANS